MVVDCKVNSEPALRRVLDYMYFPNIVKKRDTETDCKGIAGLLGIVRSKYSATTPVTS